MSINKAFFNGPGGLVVPRLAADPSSPINGEIYYNTTDSAFKKYEGGVWAEMGADENALLKDGTVALDNNVFLKARNFLNNADLNILKVDTNNEIVLGSSGHQRIQIGDLTGAGSVINISRDSGNTFIALEQDYIGVYTGLTGTIDIGGTIVNLYTADTATTVRFHDNDGSHYVGLKANGTTTTSYTLTLPPVAPALDQILKSDASGNLSWSADAGGITWATPIDSHITVDAHNTYDVGTSLASLRDVHLRNVIGTQSSMVIYSGGGNLTLDADTTMEFYCGSERFDFSSYGTSSPELRLNGLGPQYEGTVVDSASLTGGSGTPIQLANIYLDDSEELHAMEVSYVITDTTSNDRRYGKVIATITNSATPTVSFSDVLGIQTAAIPYVFNMAVSGDRATLEYTSTGANNSTMTYVMKRIKD